MRKGFKPLNALGFSGGAPRDREGGRADSRFQNGLDLVGAKRRPLEALVGWQRGLGLYQANLIGVPWIATSAVNDYLSALSASS